MTRDKTDPQAKMEGLMRSPSCCVTPLPGGHGENQEHLCHLLAWSRHPRVVKTTPSENTATMSESSLLFYPDFKLGLTFHGILL